MKTLVYHGEEPITEKEAKEIRKFFGSTNRCPYNYIEEYEINQDYGTFCNDLVQLLIAIQMNPVLNEEETKIIELRDKGKDIYSRLNKLLNKAVKIHQNQTGEYINTYSIRFEIARYYGLPMNGTIQEILQEAREKTKGIKRPTSIPKVKFTCYWKDQTKTLKCYTVKMKDLSYSFLYQDKGYRESLIEKFPYLDYVRGIREWRGNNYELEIDVHDHADRHWSFYNVLNAMLHSRKIGKTNFLEKV